MAYDPNDPLSPLESLPVETIELLLDLLRDLADAIENRHCARLINAQRHRSERQPDPPHHRQCQPDPFNDGRSTP